MNKFFLVLISIFSLFSASSQIIEPVKWQAEVNALDSTTYTLKFTALIDSGWHLYSQIEVGDGDGPLPTEFIFDEEGYSLIGKTTEPYAEPHFDEVFEMDITYFNTHAEFVQTIKVNNPELKFINVELSYMACDDERCIADGKEFRLFLDGKTPSGVYTEDVSTVQPITTDATSIDNTNIEKDQKKTEKRSLWAIFIIAFLSGFAALLTPCVFPMIPLTVSFFTKQSKTRAKGIKNAIIYGVSIVVIYVFLGWLVTFLFGADALNELSTNVWFNIAFFVLLVVFAISFLGAFEITLPQSWANKVDKQSGRGGAIGIFFMAMALAIVSFSCTGPIVGALLFEAATTGGLAPIIGMLGFSLALAIPFMLFAMFPGWLNSLPKSGGWLNTVKVVLGFLELALAFKFLSNADLVLQSHLLEREVFLAIWIAVFGALTLYLFGKIKLPHDSPTESISVGRMLFGLVILTFTLYLVPGLWGAPLKIISGFPPPMNYSESPYGVGNSSGGTITEFKEGMPEGAKLGPNNILTFTDYDKGVAYAKSINKPILIDFTGHACVNCRKMEERVWAEPQILNILKNDIVLISLYVDERTPLPESEQYISPTTGKKIKTIGNKWSDFQIKNYEMNAQPYYVLIELNEKNLNVPVGYTPDIYQYEAWLQEGINAFNNNK